MSNSLTLERLTVELASALTPLSDALDNSESLLNFAERLGWELPDGTSEIGIDRSMIHDVILRLEEVVNLQSDSTQDSEFVKSKYTNLAISLGALTTHIYNARNEVKNHLSQAFLAASKIADDLPKRLLDYLIIRYVKTSDRLLYEVFMTLGIFELKKFEREAGSFTSNHTRHIIHFDRILYLFGKFDTLFKEVYGWGTSDAKLSLLLERLNNLFILFGFPAKLDTRSLSELDNLWSPVPVPREGILEDEELKIWVYRKEGIEIDTVEEEAGFSLLPLPAIDDTKGPGLAIIPFSSGVFERDIPLGEAGYWFLKVITNLNLISGIGFIIRPHENLKILRDISGSGALNGEGSVTLDVRYQYPLGDELFPIIDIPNTFNLAARVFFIRIKFLVSSEGKSELLAEVGIEEGKIRLSSEGADSFIKRFLPRDGIEVAFDIGVGWSSHRGTYLIGGSGNEQSGFDKSMIIGKSIGPLTLSELNFSLRPNEENIKIIISASGIVKFGPLEIHIDKIGLISQLEKINSEELLEILHSENTFNFKPPDGLGVLLNTNGLRGGGIIWKHDQEYVGVMDLDIRGISVQAIALLDTRDTSFLFAIFSNFRSAIQLGAGWKITKIGGMIGIYRTVSHKDITNGIRSGILNSILFPDNVIENASRIISDIKKVFPANPEQHFVGPAVRVEYGTPTLISGDILLILEFPNPFQLSVIGRIKARIPDEEHPLIQINLGVLGAIDFTNGKLEIYGSLYDSKILDFTLSGDMAMAVSWGSEKNFIFSVGGFNPKFTVPSNFPPFGAPPLKRLNLAFSSYVTFECYLALTSNTLQIGARVEAKFEKSGAKISGFLGFDALIQFNPLYYVIDVAGGFSVSFKGRSLTSITFSGFIEGPNPHRIVGSLTFSILWWDISIDVDKTFGDQLPEVVSLVNPWPLLKEALEQNDSWTADQPNWLIEGVTFKESSSGVQGIQMIHPLGNLKVSQRVVPLNFTLTKFGSSTPIDNFRFEISSLNNIPASNLVSTEDYFAPAQFAEYDNEQKLTLKSYDLMDSGVFVASTEKELLFDDKSMSTKEISYETIVWNDMTDKEKPIEPEKDRFNLDTKLSETFILAGSAYQTSLSNNNQLRYKLNNRVKEQRIIKEKFVIIDEEDNKPVDSIKAFAIAVLKIPKFEYELSQAAALNILRDYSLNNPQDKRNLKVVSSSELVEVVS